MLPTLLRPALLVLVAGGAPTPVATLKDLGPALTACFQSTERSTGSAITVRFSLTSTGAVLGKPRVTYSKLNGSPDDQTAFVAAALGALIRCTPVDVTPALGRAIAGRPLSVRFVGGGTPKSI